MNGNKVETARKLLGNLIGLSDQTEREETCNHSLSIYSGLER